jgi:hypothetical protein
MKISLEMKKSLKISLLFIGLAGLFACNKDAGRGGVASISGTILGVDHEKANNEVTEIIFSDGSEVEHGEYWLLNSPDSSEYLYIWYDNPNWVTDGDPELQGRTGVKVSFEYSDNNLTIAQNTAIAVSNASSVFTISITNDILIITSNISGECPDAHEVSSPFEVNVDKQGKDGDLTLAEEVIDEDVFITYGEGVVYDDKTTTGVNGGFQFKGLLAGNYVLNVSSKDTISGGYTVLSQEVQISKEDTEVNVGEITIVQ